MPRTKGSTQENIENRWYDLFASWTFEDREVALRTLGHLHRQIGKLQKTNRRSVTAQVSPSAPALTAPRQTDTLQLFESSSGNQTDLDDPSARMDESPSDEND